MKTRRSAVFVIPNSIVGHKLVFRHHTNKVVVGNYVYDKENLSNQKKFGQQKRKNTDS
jgi:hypothetical protein